ncbi:acyl-ACP--UDP-N-acetylglucosamine O-acyltransferase [Salidesulfovibrio brasiliensis]|uniref:acyl-ACP--UDP-N-acetylglucosamine O-acyltransferase n=1 Tax=Salidesulfovibrio brasiliensis TaxID=221711 RepID=UPI0006D2754D|nr:acyl-ACP--UDP-N-acetylglucosamine O-acyltransferase [Salidesulfovibrio brasiliensis]
MASSIHPTAVIDPTATIGEDVTVGPYVVVEANSTVGDGCKLEPFALIKANVTMGKANHVHSNAVIGGDPQHLGYKGEDTFLRVGDNNIFREGVTIHRGTTQGGGETVIGSNCLLMAYAHVAHDCAVGDNVIMANAVLLAGHVEVGSNVIISGMAAVQQFVRIGDFAFLGGASGYNLDVPPYMLAHGVRGKLYGPNLIGLRRNGFDSTACKALKKAYKIIFRSGMTKEQAFEKVAEELPGIDAVDNLVAFIRESKNGVTPASIKNGNGDER